MTPAGDRHSVAQAHRNAKLPQRVGRGQESKTESDPNANAARPASQDWTPVLSLEVLVSSIAHAVTAPDNAP